MVFQQTDKSMVELELELNQRTGEWNTLQESGSDLRPLHGPALTGLNNLGNSCYINSVVQVCTIILCLQFISVATLVTYHAQYWATLPTFHYYLILTYSTIIWLVLFNCFKLIQYNFLAFAV